MPAKLTFHPPARASRFLIVREGESLSVGRDGSCSLVLDDPRVSKRHALLTWQGSGWRLEDLGSKNGTSANGRPADGTELCDGDWLSFGGLLGRFERIDEERLRSLDSDRLARLQTSVEMRRRLAERDPFDMLLDLLESARQVAGAERGFVMVAGPDGGLRVEVAAGFDASELREPEPRFQGSLGVLRQALESARSVVVCDAQRHPSIGQRPSVAALGLGTIACVPLRQDERLIGMLYLDSRKSGQGLSELDLQILDALAEQAALLIAGLKLDRRIRELLRETPAALSPPSAMADDVQRLIQEAAARGAPDPGAASRGSVGR